jgi:murein L,D-transpeptidase YafK
VKRSGLVRALMATAAIASAVALAGCDGEGLQISEKHLKPLPGSLVAEIARKDMSKESPILVRLFKQEAEFEVWKQDRSGRFALLKTYPICRWSGELGPKIKEGDRQAPEGFYTITPAQMNPKSQFHLAFNLGYPNAFDRAHGRTGAALMVHGDCSSRGCYAMTDEQVSEIYALGRESFFGGQRAFQVQAYPFRMNPLNMARHRTNPNMPFWKNLKQGYDHFEVTRQQPKVDVCEKRYVFDAQAGNFSQRLDFNPTGKCPVFEVPEEIASAVREKNSKDESATLALIKRGTPAAPIRTGQDGGMHPVFLAAMKGPSITDTDGNFRPTLAPSTPGTIPAHARAPGDASPVYAPDAAAPASEKPTGSVMAANVPVPRPAPHKERAPGSSNFAQRPGSFLTASSPETKPAPAPTAAAPPTFRNASAEPKPAAAAANSAAKPGLIAQPANKQQQLGTLVGRPEAKPKQPAPIERGARTAASVSAAPASAPQPAAPAVFDSRWSAFR